MYAVVWYINTEVRICNKYFRKIILLYNCTVFACIYCEFTDKNNISYISYYLVYYNDTSKALII